MSGDPPQFASSPSTPTSASQSLGKAVGRGFSWLTASLVVGKLFGAIAQLALGRWISDEQFRDFAIVASVAALVKVFQDGGVPQLLIQRGKDEFDRLLGPAFWLSAAFGLAGGAILAALAPTIASWYETPKLAEYLWIVSVTLPLGAPATILRAKMQVALRFKAVAIIAVFCFLIRQLSAVTFAAIGFGVLGLVLPFLLVTLFEWAAAFYATRIKPWRRPLDFCEWAGLFSDSLWVIATAVCRGLSRTGDYLVLGLLAPPAIVGQYFFGYQTTTQIVEMLATNLQHVLFPALSRLAGEPKRQSHAIVRTIRLLVFVAAPVSLCLAVAVRPGVELLDQLIWMNKWSSTIPLMQILAVAAPVRMFPNVLAAALSSRGMFRTSALLTLAEGLWLMAAAGAAYALVGANLAGLATVIVVSQTLFSVIASAMLLRDFDIQPQTFLRAFLPSWLVSLGVAGATVVPLWLLPEEAGNATRLVAGFASFAALFALAARTLLRHDLDELIRVLPSPIARVIQRALLLRRSLPA